MTSLDRELHECLYAVAPSRMDQNENVMTSLDRELHECLYAVAPSRMDQNENVMTSLDRELHECLYAVAPSRMDQNENHRAEDRKNLETLNLIYDQFKMYASCNETYQDLITRYGDVNAETYKSYKNRKHSYKYKVMSKFPKYNFDRLALLRIKRLADAWAEVAKSEIFKNTIDKSNLFLSILGVIWYLPRFMRNTYILLKHLFTADFSSLSDYWKKHWFDWCNDAAWIATGLITLGISSHWYLAGASAALGPGGIILTVSLYAFDVINAAIKAQTKLNKIDRAINQLRKLKIERNLNYYENQIKKLEKYRDFVKRDQLTKIIGTIGLLAGMALMLTNPIGVAIGASLVILTITAQWWMKNKYIPNKEIQYHHDPFELIHKDLLQFAQNNNNHGLVLELKEIKCDDNYSLIRIVSELKQNPQYSKKINKLLEKYKSNSWDYKLNTSQEYLICQNSLVDILSQRELDMNVILCSQGSSNLDSNIEEMAEIRSKSHIFDSGDLRTAIIERFSDEDADKKTILP